MRIRFWTIPVFGDDDLVAELNGFLATHRIFSIDRHLVHDGGASMWALAVSYLDPEGRKPPIGRKGRVDYREVLSESDFAEFAKLLSSMTRPASRPRGLDARRTSRRPRRVRRGSGCSPKARR